MNLDNLMICIEEQVTPEVFDDLILHIEKLEKEKNNYRNQLLNTRHELIQKDAEMENQKTVIDNLEIVVKQYTKENEHLRGLIKIWI